ncbi:MAG: phospho-N-acetylmuramoyl-pentapeptide-transferase [Lentisphaeria bacterium]|nr:phospho-N-acetylmuramoyl-pentapeptide-transferase [Lentisphaeria bacterium]
MIFYILEWLNEVGVSGIPTRIFNYITFRAGGAAFSAFVISIIFGPYTIRALQNLQTVAPNRLDGLVEDDAETKAEKKNTPSMGGILILLSTGISIAIWGNWSNQIVQIFVLFMMGLGLTGFLDDYLKVKKQSRDGISSRVKLLYQLLLSAAAVIALDSTTDIVHIFIPPGAEETTPFLSSHGQVRNLWIPFFKEPIWMAMPFAVVIALGMLVTVGSSNAVNLTDGMDGLATGCTVIACGAYAIFAYLSGHYNFANYLNIPFIRGAGEVTVLTASIIGACLGFLWYNCKPAGMFMGDTGSLALGGCIGLIAILVKQELLLVVIGGVFVMETLSVMMQVSYYKLTRKLTGTPKRIFKCAPIHHHFKQSGWQETQIVMRFWIIAFILAVVGLATLKLR